MSAHRRTIVALGGGGFSTGETNIDDYVLGLARSKSPRVCFLSTASGDSPTYIVRFYRAFHDRGCMPIDLTLFGSPSLPRHPATTADLRSFVLAQDVVYVGGGNTANMLAVWRAHGLDAILREAWEQGIVLCGPSAGAICWFEHGVSDASGAELGALDRCLGLLPGSFCPHYDSDPARRPAFARLVGGGMPAGWAAEDGVALHFEGTALEAVVAARADARAYRVEMRGDRVVEEARVADVVLG